MYQVMFLLLSNIFTDYWILTLFTPLSHHVCQSSNPQFCLVINKWGWVEALKSSVACPNCFHLSVTHPWEGGRDVVWAWHGWVGFNTPAKNVTHWHMQCQSAPTWHCWYTLMEDTDNHWPWELLWSSTN